MSLPNNLERLLILIPAYNEAGTIRQVVQDVRGIVPQADVLVVDDGSIDNTAQEAKLAGAFVIQHPFNLCVGGAVQTGLKFALQQNYDMVVRLDGDGQHNPADIPLLCSVLQARQVDVVIGSRFLDTNVTMPIPLMRRFGIYIFAHAISLLTGSQATDTTSGFLGLNRRAIKTLVLYMPQDYPEVESRIIQHRTGLITLELPTEMRARFAGISSINTQRSIYYAFKVFVAMVIATIKDFSAAPQEISHVDTP